MECEQISNYLLDYLDDELAEDERRLIENHLDACAACRKKVEGYKNAFEMLDQWQPPPPSEGFEERVLQRLRSLPMPKKPIWQRILDMFNGEVNQETPVRADAVAFPRHWQPVAAMAVLLIAAPIFTYYVMKGPDVTDRNREMPPIIIGTETKPTDKNIFHAIHIIDGAFQIFQVSLYDRRITREILVVIDADEQCPFRDCMAWRCEGPCDGEKCKDTQ